jgi:DNA-binding NarL/FixJ family response regulator
MIRILIADDHAVVRSGIRGLLEAQPGWTVVAEAENGKEALDKALSTHPEVVILDYSMPLLNGVEVTRSIRARLPEVEVLIFTMHDTDALVREVLEAGARGFLLKSDAPQSLIAAVKSLAAHQPFFTSKVSETLLKSYLAKKEPSGPVLTAREQSIVKLIAEGKTNKEIANFLSISRKTVEAHRSSAMRKLGLDSTISLVRYAIRNKLSEA